MAARFRLLSLSALLLPLMPMVGMNPALADQPAAAASRCNNATLKGTYLYSSIGVLDGKPYAESGREVYDGKGGVVLTYSGSGGAASTMKAT